MSLFSKEGEPDPVELAARLSHELEQAQVEIARLTAANRELGMILGRAEAARDVLKEMVREAMKRP